MPSVGGVPKGQMPGGSWWLFNVLSALMSALAIVALARHAFVTWSLSAPMALIMDAYNGVMQVLFGWAHPYLQAALTWLGSFIGWRPTLYAHWRDVFALVTLLVTAAGHGRPPLLRAIGAVGATTLVAGLARLHSDYLVVQLVIAASFGIVILSAFLVGAIWRNMNAKELRMPLVVIAIAALATWWLSLQFGVPGSGLAGLAGTIVLLAYFGSLDSNPEPDMRKSAQTVLTGFFGAFCFFAIDAGLKLLMG